MKLTLALIFTASTLLAQSNTYVLRATRLFDGVSDALVEPGVIVVANGMIQSVGSRAVPSGATVIDLGDATLLPGFIDTHTHLSDDFNPDYNGARLLDLERPVSEKAFAAFPKQLPCLYKFRNHARRSCMVALGALRIPRRSLRGESRLPCAVIAMPRAKITQPVDIVPQRGAVARRQPVVLGYLLQGSNHFIQRLLIVTPGRKFALQ
jgi:hypothetical protein